MSEELSLLKSSSIRRHQTRPEQIRSCGQYQVRVDKVRGDARLAQVGAAQASVGESDVQAEERRARVQTRQEVSRADVGDHSCVRASQVK